MARAARDALLGGADMLQLRDKRGGVLEVARAAKAIGTLCRRHKVHFLVNDRVEAAVADGAHVGQGDIAPELARKILGPRKILGVSASDTRRARSAKSRGASYVGAGPVFRTPIKSDTSAKGVLFLKKLKCAGVPLMAIGGIDAGNIRKLRELGVGSVAVIRAFCSRRNKLQAAKNLKRALVQ
jgi:thiamine-phosphate diphosphorylase